MSRTLYTNAHGKQISAHSHSGGGDWRCPRKYYYKRVEGWQPRDERAALQFGKCVESAIQYFHAKDFVTGSGVDEFKVLWWRFKDDETLTYTEKSGDWEDHYQMGTELLSLYEIEHSSLPLDNPQFQVDIRTDLFPGTEYDGLRYTTILDMVCEVAYDHPLLPPSVSASSSSTRKIIVDIKTSAASYYTDPRLSCLDDQLRDYSWATGIETVAFLVLVKNHSSIGTGDWVTVLRGAKVGKKYQAFNVEGDTILVLTKQDYDEYISRKKEIKGKGSKEAQEVLLTEFFYKGYRFSRKDLTKQRIQFLPAIISEEDRIEARKEAEREAMEIADCSLMKYFPKKPGVRYPNNVCTSCECLGLCIGDPELVKEKLIKIDGEF